MKSKILVIDKDLATLNLLRQILSAFGYTVETARQLPDGMALKSPDLKPDLIVIDEKVSNFASISQLISDTGIVLLALYSKGTYPKQNCASAYEYRMIGPFMIKELVAKIRCILTENDKLNHQFLLN